jgi:hypothetical protein
MNPLIHNPDLANRIARRTIDDRIHDAREHAKARAVRAELRAARRQSRAAAPASHATHPNPARRSPAYSTGPRHQLTKKLAT